MRGSDSHEGYPPPSNHRPPLPPSQYSHVTNGASIGYKSSGRQGGYGTAGSHVISSDVISFSEGPHSSSQAAKHRRTPGSSSDPVMAYKRVIESEALKDTGSDMFIRPPKTKVAKSKSDSTAVESRSSAKYLTTPMFGKTPKRQRQTKRDKAEKLSASKLPKSDSERPTLDRRSKTFVLEPHAVSDFPQERYPEVLWREPQPKLRHRKPTQRQDMTSDSRATTKRDKEFDSLPEKRSTDQQHVSDSVKPEVVKRPEMPSRSHRHQWQESAEVDRDGARNPLYISTNSMPIRPKSAGQLRYCASDDSDESSLDGEIEIVDIDKELEDDPSEPSPYWSEGQPLHVPEVFINEQESSLPFNTRGGYPTQSQQHDSLHHRPVQHRYLAESRSSHLQDVGPRERHNSGESDLSAVSDTIIKPISNANGRRRFMSEPEILSEPYVQKNSRRGAPDTRYRNNGADDVSPRRGAGQYMRESSRDRKELSSVTAANLARQSREKLYSDAMERVLSRYSELAVRDKDEISTGSKKLKGPRTPNLNSGPTSGSHPASGSGFIMPPRKLKPINRQPRNNMNEPS